MNTAIEDIEYIEDEEDLDSGWITEFKKNESLYKDFYKEKVEQIKLFYLYVGSSNTLETIKKDVIPLDQDGILKKNTIITLIKKNQIYNSIKYKLLSLIRFNIDIEPDEINKFILSTSSSTNETSRFITHEKYLNDIKYSNTISIFQDLNCLYFIFYEDTLKIKTRSNVENQTTNSTKKIISIATKKMKANMNKRTRRIFL